jgi:hypothetical protein
MQIHLKMFALKQVMIRSTIKGLLSVLSYVSDWFLILPVLVPNTYNI